MPNSRNELRLNVGFLINASVGVSRDFTFEIPHIRLEPDLQLHDFSGTARITRTAQGLLVQGKMRATLPEECVRCLSNFQQTLQVNFTELYAFSRESVTDSGLILPENAHIDLTPLVREYMLLELPISPLCREDCKGLCPICGGNLNETICDHEEDSVDPRLAVLKSLLNKKE